MEFHLQLLKVQARQVAKLVLFQVPPDALDMMPPMSQRSSQRQPSPRVADPPGRFAVDQNL
jgi:hypothetical protein